MGSVCQERGDETAVPRARNRIIIIHRGSKSITGFKVYAPQTIEYNAIWSKLVASERMKAPPYPAQLRLRRDFFQRR